MHKKINTILFDLDGTLIDSNELIIDSFKAVLKKYMPNRKFSRSELIDMIGPPLTETLRVASTDKQIIQEMIDEFRAFYVKHEFDYVKVYPHVMDMLKYFSDKNFNLGIVTTKYSSSAIPGIKHFKIDEFVKVFCFLDNISKHKPDAEPIIFSLNQFEDVQGAVMVGDNTADIMAGKNANILTCSVNWSLKKDLLDSLNPDFKIDSYIELIEYIENYNKENK